MGHHRRERRARRARQSDGLLSASTPEVTNVRVSSATHLGTRTESGACIGFGVFPKMTWDKSPRRMQVSYVYRVESRSQWCFVLVDGTRDWLDDKSVMAHPRRELLLDAIRCNEQPDDSRGPKSSVDLVRWLRDALRDRRNSGQHVRRLVMNAGTYVNLVCGDRRFMPVAAVDAVTFSGLPISINETFTFKEVGFYG